MIDAAKGDSAECCRVGKTGRQAATQWWGRV